MEESKKFYDAVYGQDHDNKGPHGWVQWKGTEVCMDLHCACGHHGHVDADFFYYYRCPACKKAYAVGQVVKLIALTPEQEAHVEAGGTGFLTDNDAREEEPGSPRPTPAIVQVGPGVLQILGAMRLGDRPRTPNTAPTDQEAKVKRALELALEDVKGEVVDELTMNKVRSKVRTALDILLSEQKAKAVQVQVTKDLQDPRKLNVDFFVNGRRPGPEFWEG